MVWMHSSPGPPWTRLARLLLPLSLLMLPLILPTHCLAGLLLQMGCTPLHCAAALPDDEIVAELLSHGASMDVQDTQVRGPHACM